MVRETGEEMSEKFTYKYDKPEKYPYGYVIHNKYKVITAISKDGYIGKNETEFTMFIKFFMVIIILFLLIIGGGLLFL